MSRVILEMDGNDVAKAPDLRIVARHVPGGEEAVTFEMREAYSGDSWFVIPRDLYFAILKAREVAMLSMLVVEVRLKGVR
ncbi:MAG TPA: hypothetical protein VFS06_03500 [Casimicrobiaceae bacterium]|nr:hypothetical protein [Casimicrobiaceae bacterium]